MSLPDHTKPGDLAAHLGVSERGLRALARSLGAFTEVLGKMILLPEHVDAIIEAGRPCRSKSTSAAKSGTTGELLPVGDYEALRAQRTKQPRSASRRKSKAAPGSVILMDRGRM